MSLRSASRNALLRVAAGLLAPWQVLFAAILCFAATILIGLELNHALAGRALAPTPLLFIGLCGCLLGVLLMYLVLVLAQPWAEAQFGLFLSIEALSTYDVGVLGLIMGCGLLMGSVPAWRAYRNSLADGLTIRL